MNTEITDVSEWMGEKGTVLYDGACGFCSRWVGFWRPVLARRGIGMAPLQTPGLAERTGVPVGHVLDDLLLLQADGRLLRGHEAYLSVARRVVWLWPLYALARLPGASRLMQRGYGWFRTRRYQVSRRLGLVPECELLERQADPPMHDPARASWNDWLPLALLPVLAWFLRDALPAWAWMWTLVVAIFLGAKWLTWRQALAGLTDVSKWRSAGYLLLWPGMDARSFLRPDARVVPPDRPEWGEWLAALGKTSLGAAFFWLVAVRTYPAQPILSAWLGMLGAILFVHFGILHLLSLAWRRAGFNAPPIMNAPARACSLNDLWSARWNTAFRDLVHERVFLPLWRRWGRVWAVLGIYLFSGLLHEVLISCPARAGFGLPTAYFVLQGLGVLLQHARLGRAWHLQGGLGGRAFTLSVAAAPVYWLFHPAFALQVFLPFMRACGALDLSPGDAP